MKILYIDMDGVLVDFQSGVDRLSAVERREYEADYDHVPGIFPRMDPMPGAIEAYQELAELFDTYILSTAPWKNPSAWSDKLLWVKKHLGDVAHKRLMLSHHKHLNVGDFRVDDSKETGERFSGEFIHFGSEDFPDWPAVLAHLKRASEE